MSNINAEGMHFQALNEQVRQAGKKIKIENALGHRYIGSGMGGVEIDIQGVPGNALGAYLDGARITVHGNAQDATGDTMNDGEIIIHGSSGGATGYGMRGGRIYIRGNTGYRAGIHMKAYQDKCPVLVIGGRAGDFLGEYQAGGNIVVLGLGETTAPVGHFCGTGQHGGAIYLRCEEPPPDLPAQVVSSRAENRDLAFIRDDLRRFCKLFDLDAAALLQDPFWVLRPDQANPYHQLYVRH